MIKKQQKWIALLVVCTFMWLMQVSTMPVAAAGTTEQISSAGAEQGPDYYEAVSQKAAPAKKKSMLPMILIGVGLLAVTAAVLFLVVLKNYNIVGSWSGPMSNPTPQTWTGTLVFSGEKKTGTVLYSDPWYTNRSGNYTVDGKNVSFTVLVVAGQNVEFTGTFVSKNKMSGTWKNLAAPTTVFGPWEMTRAGSSAQQPTIQSLGAGKGVIKDN
jgi:hypothetical protein